jgi:uncharacterized protein with FMN-binding domain
MPAPPPAPPVRRPPASLARRAAPAVVLTASGLALLLQLDRPVAMPGPEQAAGQLLTSEGAAAAAALGTTPTVPATVGTVPAIGSTDPIEVTGGATTAAPVTTAPPAIDATAATTVGACTGEVVSGPVVSTRWGPVQVAAIVSADGRLCSVDAVQTPWDDRKSVEINDYAVPLLNARALAAGTDFDAVSGATVTSEGYRRSLQAVLDAA